MELPAVILEGEDAGSVVDVGAPLALPANEAAYGLDCLVKQVLGGGQVEEEHSSPPHPAGGGARTTDPIGLVTI